MRSRIGRIIEARLRPSQTLLAPPVVTGVVEQFSRRMVVGWVSVPAEAPPTRVTLHLGTLQLTSTYATVSDSLSGPWPSSKPFAAPPAGAPAAASVVPATRGPQRQQPLNIASPAGDRRNSSEQIRTFAFRVREIWPYVKKSTRITVQADGQPLPIHGHGMYLSPPKRGRKSVEELRSLMAQGYVLSQFGRIQLSKKLDTAWQQRVMSLYHEARKALAEELGYEAFLIYGTLLGAVRENGFIGHDGDFDAAYVSRHTDPRAAAAEMQELALRLIERGFYVECMESTLHVHDPHDRATRIDIFHLYFDEDGMLRFPFGIAGSTTIRREQWQGSEEIDFVGYRALIPQPAEALVEHIYGPDWRRPKSGFNWKVDRTDAAPEARLTPEQSNVVYWANFYASIDSVKGSPFFEYVNARPDTPDTVLDIGCGDGRDSCAFGGAGRRVLGLDRSPVGIEHARAKADSAKLGERVAFEVCDVADSEHLAALVAGRLAVTEGPAMFYLRFFLHAIPEDAQEAVMRVIAHHARPGDMFAAEFRTDKDLQNRKVHGRHYRRFQNAAAFSARLQQEHGFSVLHEEERTGLSPYQDEDPVLYRVVARR